MLINCCFTYQTFSLFICLSNYCLFVCFLIRLSLRFQGQLVLVSVGKGLYNGSVNHGWFITWLHRLTCALIKTSHHLEYFARYVTLHVI